MRLVVNGDAVEAEAGITVQGLLKSLDLAAGPVAVERNGEVVPRAEHPTTTLSEGDTIEVVHFVGGG
jgi:sulfur carrier protein